MVVWGSSIGYIWKSGREAHGRKPIQPGEDESSMQSTLARCECGAMAHNVVGMPESKAQWQRGSRVSRKRVFPSFCDFPAHRTITSTPYTTPAIASAAFAIGAFRICLQISHSGDADCRFSEIAALLTCRLTDRDIGKHASAEFGPPPLLVGNGSCCR
jgi:hypothetical protein